MTAAERHQWEKTLLAQIHEIGESVKDITPENGHLSMTWFPGGYVNVFLCTGEMVKDKDGNESAEMVLNAWGDMKGGALEVHRL